MKHITVREPLSDAQHTALSAYPELLRTLLVSRGIKNAEEAETFLHPDYEEGTHDPFLLSGMEEAVARILTALEKKETIVIYSDYDADGIPGAVVLHDLFMKCGHENFSNYIPHRNEEGFGLHTEAIEQFAKNDVSLIITVDCGSTDVEQIDRAKELGIDVIVTDHHLMNGAKPDAVAVINPNKKGDTYPNKGLCGAGVAFKLAQAVLARTEQTVPDGWDKWLLDMVGIATLSDMVPLVGENRVLARYGLTVLRKSRRIGLRKLLKKLRIKQSALTEDDVVFSITPRINAASRMDVPEDAFRLLATTDHEEAETIVKHLDSLNNQRKGVVAGMVKEIKHRVANLAEVPRVLVMGNPEWRPGLAGLAAHKAAESYDVPTFIWGTDAQGVIKGSCRSNGSVDVVALMEARSEHFLEFGGHAFSGGFSVSHEHIHTLGTELSAAYETVPTDETNNGEIVADAALSLEEVDAQRFKEIAKLTPFGKDNPKPVFLFQDVVVSEVKHFGKHNEHIRLIFKRQTLPPLSAIQFFVGEESVLARIAESTHLDLVATLEQSTFGGRTELRLRIIEIVG